MSVVFDLYLFDRDYIEKVKKKQKKDSGRFNQDDVDFEIGSVACRNSQRKQAIFFYTVNELMELLEAAYAVSADRFSRDQLLEPDHFPDDSGVGMVIELDSLYAGRFIEPDGEQLDFSSREELESHITGKTARAV